MCTCLCVCRLYMEVFNLPMEIKTAQDILKMAVKTSDGQLAILAFQVSDVRDDGDIFVKRVH